MDTTPASQPNNSPSIEPSQPPRAGVDQRRGLIFAGVAALVLLFAAGVFWFLNMHGANHAPHIRQVITGTPLQVDDQTMAQRAADDAKPLLARHYVDFYGKLGAGSSDVDATANRDFAASMESLEKSGGCTSTIGALDKKQGTGLDSNPNAVTANISVVCAGASYDLSMLFYGNGMHPEAFSLFSAKIVSGDAAFATAIGGAANAQFLLIASNKSVPAKSTTITLGAPTDAERFAQNGTLGTNCALSAAPSSTLMLSKTLHGDIAITKALVSFRATCDTIRS